VIKIWTLNEKLCVDKTELCVDKTNNNRGTIHCLEYSDMKDNRFFKAILKKIVGKMFIA